MVRTAVLLLILAGSAAVAASAPVRVEGITLDEQVRDASREAAQAQAQQKRLQAAAAKARDEVVRLRAQQLAAAQGIAAAEAAISAADARARLLQAQLAAQRERLAIEQAPASSLLAALAIMSRRPPLLVLADGGSAEDFVKLKLLLAETAPAIEARTAGLSRQLQRTAKLQAEAVAARSAMQQARHDLARQRQEFAALEARAIRLAEERGAAALGAGDAALATSEELSQLQQAARTGSAAAGVARELAALGPALLPQPASAEPPPLDYRLPAEARVVDGLGAVSENGIRSRGVTLATRRGQQLVAPASGTVLFAGPFREYDGVVILDHGGGWTSVIVNAGSSAPRGARLGPGAALGTALGPVEVQLQRQGRPVSAALIAGSSQMLSKTGKSD